MPGRRPLVVLVALFAVPLPACLHVSTQVEPAAQEDPKPPPKAPDAPQPPRILFAELPRIPGTFLPTRVPNPPVYTAAQNPPAPLPLLGPPKPPDPVRPAGGDEFAPMAQPPAEAPLVAAVRAYTEGRPDRAIEIIRTLKPQNQDLVLALLPVLAAGSTADLNNDQATVGALVDQLRAAAARIEPRAALRIEKLAFCDDVKAFGRFVVRSENLPYKPNAQANLYLELRNLGSTPAGNEFVTSVQAVVEVRDSNGKLVEQIDPLDYRRRVPIVRFEKRLPTQSPLHDFHVLYIFSAPAAPGVYYVTVELRDSTGQRTVKSPPVRFDVAGP